MSINLIIQGLLAIYGEYAQWWLVFLLVAFLLTGLGFIMLYLLRNFLGRW